MNFSKYVEKQKKLARINNIKEIRKDIDKTWVKTKISNHVKAFDGLFSYEEIKQAILENDIVASKFCKDPNKQNISEKLVEKILKIKKLPSQGKGCVRFDKNGQLVHSAYSNTKSADFYYNGYYVTQKYTREEGGGQDNQRNDVIDFLEKGSINYKVMAIVDGQYWDKWRPILKKQFYNNPNVIITSVSELTKEIEYE